MFMARKCIIFFKARVNVDTPNYHSENTEDDHSLLDDQL